MPSESRQLIPVAESQSAAARRQPPIRVLFVIGSMGGGGAERQLVDLLRHFNRSRIRPALYLAQKTGELLDEVPADVPVDAFHDGRSRRSWNQRLWAKLRCPSRARSLHIAEVLQREPADLVFAWSLLCAYEAVRPAHRRQIPCISYCVVDPVQEVELVFPGKFPSPWRAARWAYASGSRLYANSEDLRLRLIEFFRLPPETVVTLQNLRDFARLDRDATGQPPNWPATGFRLLAVGRLHTQKGFHILLDSLAAIRRQGMCEFQLIVLGQGPEEQALRRQAAEANLADRVLFAGYQPNPAPYYRSADLFVLPSLYEGLPNSLLEALALGVPVIAADCPTGPQEVLQGGRFGRLVPPNDASALAAAIVDALDHLGAARAQAEAGAKSVRERFGVETNLRRLEDELADIVRSTSASHRS